MAAIIMTLAILVFLYLFWVLPWLFPPATTKTGLSRNHLSPAERLQIARQHLRQGHFRLAAKLLQEDVGAEQDVDMRRHWEQLRREAALLADLLAEPLEDLLGHAAGMAQAEWQADFPHRYQGKALLFDAEVKRRPDGRLEIAYQLRLGKEPAKLDVSDLELLRKLKLDQPRRLIFGARLASVSSEPPGPTWVVRLQPTSGVWLTDADAAALCCPSWSDEATREVLREQARW